MEIHCWRREALTCTRREEGVVGEGEGAEEERTEEEVEGVEVVVMIPMTLIVTGTGTVMMTMMAMVQEAVMAVTGVMTMVIIDHSC